MADPASMEAGAIRSRNPSRTYRNPVPRGARRYLRPVADNRSHPRSWTRVGSCPTDWQASSRNGTPALRHRAPISGAGLTSPPWDGTWETATSRTAGSSMRAASAVTSNWPHSSSGTTSTRMPRRSRASSRLSALDTYSARDVRTTSPSARGRAQNARSQASDALWVSATSDGDAPSRAATDR